MSWDKIKITNDAGEVVDAQAPVIVSASRSTDIPAFYADWFVERWKKGYVKWTNPFNGVPLYVSFKNTRAVVFWSKNPRPMLKHLDFLDIHVKNYYFQYSLNDYEKEGYEGNVPPLDKRIETFITLSEKIGKDKIIWRFDPLLLTEQIEVNELLVRVKNIGDQLVNYTNKLVFSYADIREYSKVANNLKKAQIPYREFSPGNMIEFAEGLCKINKSWKLELATCAEKVPLEKYGITHNKCIDDDLMIKLFRHDKKLMEFLGVKYLQTDIFNTDKPQKEKKLKDKGQRADCGCMISKDIGQYNTCPHECVYCYANTSKEIARKNYKTFKENPNMDTIV
jgi:DNA repair photolyase